MFDEIFQILQMSSKYGDLVHQAQLLNGSLLPPPTTRGFVLNVLVPLNNYFADFLASHNSDNQLTTIVCIDSRNECNAQGLILVYFPLSEVSTETVTLVLIYAAKLFQMIFFHVVPICNQHYFNFSLHLEWLYCVFSPIWSRNTFGQRGERQEDIGTGFV